MKDHSLDEKIISIRSRLGQARYVVVLTGAGVSAESGVPTFRGKDGLWRKFRATDLATPEAFVRDPRLVWEFYNWRRELLAPLQPNAAHHAIARMEKQFPAFLLITQNIDGLHQAAGSSNVLELHGNIWLVKCPKCGSVSEDRRVPLPPLPACDRCGGLLRPHVVWFGETLDSAVLERAYEAIRSCDMMIVTGTSGNVQPAAAMGLDAMRNGAFVAEVNLEATPYSVAYDESILGRSGEILPRLLP
jgi:NAD-dependent deacetylase